MIEEKNILISLLLPKCTVLRSLVRLRRAEHLRSWVRDQPDQHGETPSLRTKLQKISQAWWHMPVIPATREPEVGEALEPGRQRLQWAEIASLHSSMGKNRETLSQKKQVVKFIKTESKIEIVGAGGWDKGSCLLDTVSVSQDEKGSGGIS